MAKPDSACGDDVLTYELYYAPSKNATPYLIASLDGINQNTYTRNVPDSTSGCYFFMTVDSAGNKAASASLIVQRHALFIHYPMYLPLIMMAKTICLFHFLIVMLITLNSPFTTVGEIKFLKLMIRIFCGKEPKIMAQQD